ncbi:MAG: YhjD/YihY/BrkB family envelope integrity protein [Acidobacteriota bacterium]
MSHAGKISKLSEDGQKERAELAADLSAATEKARGWSRRAGPWLFAVAGVAAAAIGAAVVASVSRRVRERSPLGRARRMLAKGTARVNRMRPRPVPVTLLFAFLRSPMVRRLLAAGAGKLVAAREGTAEPGQLEGEASGEGDRAAARDERPDDRGAVPAAKGPPPASPAGKAREQARAAGLKESANRAAPSEGKGEEKAKETLGGLKRAPFSRKLRFVFELFRDTFRNFQRDEALTRGAALAYYTVLSLAPLLIVVVAVAGLAFGQDEVRTRILAQIQGLVGADASKTVGEIMQKASKPSSSIPATIIGVGTLLLGAGGVFGYLQRMMNTIWGVPEKKGGGIWNLIRSRFLSLAMVLGTGFLLLVSLVVSAALSAVGRRAGEEVGLLFGTLHTVLSWAVVGLLFALIFRYLPDTRIAWRDVWIGAGITSLLFALGQFLIGLYLGRSSVASIYGGAGSLLIVLLWTYYSGLILLFGAEMTQVFANRWGSRRVASAGAPAPAA